MLVIAHRGCSYPGFNQNTIRSYRHSVEIGASAFEFDVQRTADGDLVVVHNLDLSEVSTGTGLVSRVGTDYVRELWAGKVSQGYDRIPFLHEVFDLCASYAESRRPVMHMELKGVGTGRPTGELLRTWIDSGSLRWSDVLASSFNWNELRSLREVCPEIQVATLDGAVRREKLASLLGGDVQELFATVFAFGREDFMIPRSADIDACKMVVENATADKRMRSILLDSISHTLAGSCYNDDLFDAAKELHAASVNLWHISLRPEVVDRAHGLGLKVFVYTMNAPADIRRCVNMGIDGFFTDFYSEALKALG